MIDVILGRFLFRIAGDLLVLLLLDVGIVLHFLVIKLQEVALDLREGLCVLLNQVFGFLITNRLHA